MFFFTHSYPSVSDHLLILRKEVPGLNSFPDLNFISTFIALICPVEYFAINLSDEMLDKVKFSTILFSIAVCDQSNPDADLYQICVLLHK